MYSLSVFSMISDCQAYFDNNTGYRIRDFEDLVQEGKCKLKARLKCCVAHQGQQHRIYYSAETHNLL